MQRKLILFFVLVLSAGTRITAQRPDDILNYIATYKDIAMEEMKRTGVPASIKLAQGIHETEAGKSILVVKSNNHFGIKCKSSWSGEKVFHDDDSRAECFRSYNMPEESYRDHSDFLRNSQRYSSLFDLDPTDFEGWAHGLKKAGYATNTRYPQIIIKLIQTYNLQDYSLIALGRMKESDRLMIAGNRIGTIEIPAEESPALDNGPELSITASYPEGQFLINNTRVIYAKANTPWLVLAEQHNIPLSRLWDFNDLEKDDDLLLKPQLIFLQRKRKVGSREFHIVKNGENLYDVSQSEGIRYESLLELNHLNGSRQPAAGEKLYLQSPAASVPVVLVNNQFADPVTPPDYTTHFVSTNETLYSISKKYGVDAEKIMKWNRLDTMNIKIGQSLVIYKNN